MLNLDKREILDVVRKYKLTSQVLRHPLCIDVLYNTIVYYSKNLIN